MIKHVVVWLAVILTIAGITLGLSSYKLQQFQAAEMAAKAQPEPVEAIAAAPARTSSWTSSTRAIGTVAAVRQLEVRNELAGTISEIGFTSGAIVEKGQLLVQFDVRQERASLAAAEAEATLAKQNLDRRIGLKGSVAFSAQEADKSRAEFDATRARAQSLEVAIEKKTITAPFRARVGITNLQPGAFLDAGTLIVRIHGVDGDAFVDFSLPQDYAAAAHNGTEVSLSGAALPGGTATAKIIAEDDSIDGSDRAVRFRALVAGLGATLRPGTFLDVQIATSKPRETVVVPLTAVRRSPNGQFVFVVVDDQGKQRARQRSVETGPVEGDDIVIEKGVRAGEMVATAGSFKLRDGGLVQTGKAAVVGAN
jgi:membrane fusion protein, multidrug efflux system